MRLANHTRTCFANICDGIIMQGHLRLGISYAMFQVFKWVPAQVYFQDNFYTVN